MSYTISSVSVSTSAVPNGRAYSWFSADIKENRFLEPRNQEMGTLGRSLRAAGKLRYRSICERAADRVFDARKSVEHDRTVASTVGSTLNRFVSKDNAFTRTAHRKWSC